MASSNRGTKQGFLNMPSAICYVVITTTATKFCVTLDCTVSYLEF